MQLREMVKSYRHEMEAGEMVHAAEAEATRKAHAAEVRGCRLCEAGGGLALAWGVCVSRGVCVCMCVCVCVRVCATHRRGGRSTAGALHCASRGV